MRTAAALFALLAVAGCNRPTVSNFSRRHDRDTSGGAVTMPLCGVCERASPADEANAHGQMQRQCGGAEVVVIEDGTREVQSTQTYAIPVYGGGAIAQTYQAPMREHYWLFECR